MLQLLLPSEDDFLTVDKKSLYSTYIDNANNNELEELGMIILDPIDVYLTTSEIFSNPPKVGQVLTQWALVPFNTHV